jgi:hypothetical protein
LGVDAELIVFLVDALLRRLGKCTPDDRNVKSSHTGEVCSIASTKRQQAALDLFDGSTANASSSREMANPDKA